MSGKGIAVCVPKLKTALHPEGAHNSPAGVDRNRRRHKAHGFLRYPIHPSFKKDEAAALRRLRFSKAERKKLIMNCVLLRPTAQRNDCAVF